MRTARITARKAITAALFAGIAALGAAMLDGNLTAAEGVVAGGMALTAGAATWRVPYYGRDVDDGAHRAGADVAGGYDSDRA